MKLYITQFLISSTLLAGSTAIAAAPANKSAEAKTGKAITDADGGDETTGEAVDEPSSKVMWPSWVVA